MYIFRGRFNYRLELSLWFVSWYILKFCYLIKFILFIPGTSRYWWPSYLLHTLQQRMMNCLFSYLSAYTSQIFSQQIFLSRYRFFCFTGQLETKSFRFKVVSIQSRFDTKSFRYKVVLIQRRFDTSLFNSSWLSRGVNSFSNFA